MTKYASLVLLSALSYFRAVRSAKYASLVLLSAWSYFRAVLAAKYASLVLLSARSYFRAVRSAKYANLVLLLLGAASERFGQITYLLILWQDKFSICAVFSSSLSSSSELSAGGVAKSLSLVLLRALLSCGRRRAKSPSLVLLLEPLSCRPAEWQSPRASSQRGNCSTEYNTPPRYLSRYRRFRVSTSNSRNSCSTVRRRAVVAVRSRRRAQAPYGKPGSCDDRSEDRPPSSVTLF
ncbi:hypothetical protein PUN28_020362 [Cardiocondyla obscurior]|uniref:Secreted protein n=1 Tax=Cardiocondyla obscurior TaxID=286306 RepID=A0AAW2E440_9HYME